MRQAVTSQEVIAAVRQSAEFVAANPEAQKLALQLAGEVPTVLADYLAKPLTVRLVLECKVALIRKVHTYPDLGVLARMMLGALLPQLEAALAMYDQHVTPKTEAEAAQVLFAGSASRLRPAFDAKELSVADVLAQAPGLLMFA